MRPALKLPLIAAASALALGAAWTLLPGGAPESGPLTIAAQAQEASAAEAPGEAAEVQPMVLGEPDAPVTMIEYASFTCPHCATFHDEVWPQLKADYVDAGLVRFEYREVFFDRPGLWAAMVARCGDGMRFFGLADMIYEDQGEWTSGQPTEIVDGLRRIGLAGGLEEAQLDACLSDGATAQALVERFEETTEADGITSTPSFVIDGEQHGNMSYAELRAILDAEIAEAQGG